MKTTSIGIIGLGWVGASTAISILHKGICNNLLVNDVKKEIAEGEAMDLNHGSAFYPSATVKSVEIEDMLHCDAIVITAGRGGKPNETRLQLLTENVKIAQNISKKLVGYQGILIIVSNPVDVLTYFYQKFTQIPASRVIGTGTLLDTARLRDMIGHELNVNPKSIHAQVVGEHGDSEVVLWSGATVGGVPLKNWPQWNAELENKITLDVRYAAYEIIKRKGATNHAIGLVTANLLKWILRDEQRVVNISAVQNNPNYLNVALSVPTLVGLGGVIKTLEPTMTSNEHEMLKASANILKNAINSVEISA